MNNEQCTTGNRLVAAAAAESIQEGDFFNLRPFAAICG